MRNNLHEGDKVGCKEQSSHLQLFSMLLWSHVMNYPDNILLHSPLIVKYPQPQPQFSNRIFDPGFLIVKENSVGRMLLNPILFILSTPELSFFLNCVHKTLYASRLESIFIVR